MWIWLVFVYFMNHAFELVDITTSFCRMRSCVVDYKLVVQNQTRMS